jgi:hypothetical protein
VDIIGHPMGRLLPDREGADLDMEVVLKTAAEYGVALEINANPQRLDLNDVHAKRALELGCLLAIDTDAHHPDHFNFAHYGVGTARRGWATAENVINAWPVERLLQWLDERGHRRPRVAARPAEITTAPPAPAAAPAQTREPVPAGPAKTKKPPETGGRRPAATGKKSKTPASKAPGARAARRRAQAN